MSLNVTAALSSGDNPLLRIVYTASETKGITSLVFFSCISLIAVVSVLSVIALSAYNNRHNTCTTDKPLFVRSHVAAYFVSLLLCDCLQAIGSIMNARWIQSGGVQAGTFCSAQGVITQAADIGAALWTFVIVLYTFNALFTEWKANKFVLLGTLVAGWCFVVAMVFCGPTVTSVGSQGAFYGISGYWCWISPEHPGARITLGYLYVRITSHATATFSLLFAIV